MAIKNDVDYGIKLFNLPFTSVKSAYSSGIIYQKDIGINAINTEGNILINYMSIPGGINTDEIVSINGNGYIYYVRPENWQSYVRKYTTDGRYSEVLEYEYASYPLSISGKGNSIYTYSLITIPKICYDPEGRGYECSEVKGVKAKYDNELNQISREIIEDESLIDGTKDYKISEDGKIYAVGTETEAVYEGSEIKYKYLLTLNINGTKKGIMSEVTDQMTPKLCVSEFIAVNSDYAMIYVTYCNIGVEINNKIYTAKLSGNDIILSVRNSSMTIKINEEEKECVYGKKVEIIDESIYSVTNCSGTNIIQSQEISGNTKWYIKKGDREAVTYVRDEDGRIYTIGYIYNVSGYTNYMDRYIEESGSGYKIYKDTTTDMQIIETGGWSQPYKVYVKDGLNNPVSGIRINYEADMPGISEKLVEFTDSFGVSTNRIKIGEKPLDYYLTAKCGDCVNEQNSVRFICCGKLANDQFSQSKVDQWSYDCYANYDGDCPGNKTSIGFRGCALTSLAMLINYYAKQYPELNITPTEPGKLNKWLRDNEGYDENNNVRFWLFYNYTRGILDYINDDSCNLGDEGCETKRKIIDKMNLELMNKRPLIIKIEYSGFSHYVITTGKCENKYVISDPAGGKEYLYDPYDKKYKLKGVRIFRWYIEMEEWCLFC